MANELPVIPLRVRKEKNRDKPFSIKQQKLEAEAVFERLWLTSEENFDPNRNCMEQLRIERTLELISEKINVDKKQVADLGVGFGEISKSLRNKGAKVDAVDIAQKPLKRLEQERDINTMQDYVPYTALKDDAYDLVVSTELIAYLPREEFRIYFSELSRLVKADGYVICSTLVDVYSEDAAQKFASFAETEFIIEKWVLSYHYLWTRFLNFFEAPKRYLKAIYEKRVRQEELAKRHGLSKAFYKAFTAYPASFFWRVLEWIFHPLTHLLKNQKGLLLALESISKFIWQEQGISHALFLGRRRPLFQPPPENERPIERKTKKIIWE